MKLPFDACTGCGACVNRCPQKAIEMRSDKEGFLRPEIDPALCTECGLCMKCCPTAPDGFTAPRQNGTPTLYAAWILDPAVRYASSSGGAFSALANAILERGGVVWGAAYDENLHVCHQDIDNPAELKRFHGSKYVQSETGDAFQKIEQTLKAGRNVLYSGTSCQVAGLKGFLGNEYDNLWTCDLICHGVPSPGLWDAYVRHLEARYKKRVVDFRFRDKRINWLMGSIVTKLETGKEYPISFMDHPFFQAFYQNLALRPCCFACQFKIVPYVADVTLGDFWSIRSQHALLEATDGISAVLINTEKGKEFVDACRDSLFLKDADFENFRKTADCLTVSSKRPLGRDSFFENWLDMPVKRLLAERVPMRGVLKRILAKLRRGFLQWRSRRPIS